MAGCLSTRSGMSSVQEHQHDLVGGQQVLPGSSVSPSGGLVASSGGIPQDGNGDLRGMDLSHNLKILFLTMFSGYPWQTQMVEWSHRCWQRRFLVLDTFSDPSWRLCVGDQSARWGHSPELHVLLLRL